MKAILSVSNKAGIVEFAQGLVKLGVEIYSTGGTATALAGAGVEVRSIGEITEFPEILEGRVKTLHPKVYGGILARRDSPEHMEQISQHEIDTIDLVVVNLYPFVQTISRPDVKFEDAIENIDIGGPSMIRAAAKNFQDVVVVVDPEDYPSLLEAMRSGGPDFEARKRFAAKAYQHTASYDTYIAGYLRGEAEAFPEQLTVALDKVQDLRYGENPHQKAAFYALGGNKRSGLAGAAQLQGKGLSYCNLLDLDGAWAAVKDFTAVAVAIVKHTNPCGLACGDELLETYLRAHAADPVSAFGGAIGVNRTVDAATASEIVQNFYDDIIAPGYSAEALDILSKKKNLRVMQIDAKPAAALLAGEINTLDVKRVSGGVLLQTFDTQFIDEMGLKVVTEREPTLEELTDLMFAWRVVKLVKSNAIVLASGLTTVGIGAGQMSRVDAVEIAIRKAGDKAARTVLASDAFFPKADGVEAAALAGVTAIVQPGGSIRDEESIRAANRHHMAMVFTGYRHFRH